MKYRQTYGNRNPKPGARKRVGQIMVFGFDVHVMTDNGGQLRVSNDYLDLPEGRYEIVKVDE